MAVASTAATFIQFDENYNSLKDVKSSITKACLTDTVKRQLTTFLLILSTSNEGIGRQTLFDRQIDGHRLTFDRHELTDTS